MKLLYALLLMTTQATAQFVFVPETHVGLKAIMVDGRNILTGCGHNFIGSYTGADLPDNISSCASNGDKLMKPMNGVGNTMLAQQLYHVPDSQNPNKIHFGGEVGPSTFNFPSVSMPMDAARDLFTHYRHSGAVGTYGKYADIPTTYYAEDKPELAIGVKNVQYQLWGETIGPEYTIRYTMYGLTKPMRLFFVNHPWTNNVEFSFASIKVGEKQNVMGSIEASRTTNRVRVELGLTKHTYVGASQELFHNVGRQDGAGWSANVLDRQNDYLVFGPYVRHVTGTAVFSLALDNVSNDNLGIATLEVYNASTSTVIASKLVTRKMLLAPQAPQDFELPFTNSAGALEFRVLYHGYSYIKIHSINVK